MPSVWRAVENAALRQENERLRARQDYWPEMVRLEREVERLRAQRPVCTFAGLHSQIEELQRQLGSTREALGETEQENVRLQKILDANGRDFQHERGKRRAVEAEVERLRKQADDLPYWPGLR